MYRLMLPKLKSIHQLLVVLFVGWILVFAYHEKFIPTYVASKCQWPQLDDTAEEIHRVLFIADPQLIDNHTYPGRNSLLLSLSQHTVDVHLNRNYHAMMAHLRPDSVYFLGDYLDNGRESSDQYYQGEVDRFMRIFYPASIQKSYKKDTNWFTNVPGNHDIGYGDGVHLHSRERFTTSFGQPNYVVVENGVEFIMMDSPSYSADDEKINSASRNFIESLPEKTRPRVLLTHEPLYRDPSMSCGPMRENPKFYVNQQGVQYRNTVPQPLSEQIIARVKPDLVFSGDDHDYCDIVHPDGPREVTVKSISLAMGVSHPAVQLLTFSVDKNKLNYSTQICYVQKPYTNIAYYVAMAVISGLSILWWNFKQRSLRGNYSILPVMELMPTSNARKISNFLQEEDTNGSMTYIPKYTHSTPSTWDNFKRSPLNKNVTTYYRQSSKFIRKWNLHTFAKNSTTFAMAVIVLYYIIFGRI